MYWSSFSSITTVPLTAGQMLSMLAYVADAEADVADEVPEIEGIVDVELCGVLVES